MDIQLLLNQAWEEKKEGKFTESLALYDQVYGELVKEATEHARAQQGTTEDEGDTRKILPKYFEEADNYLRRDNVVCTILNNMGVIFAELGDKDAARKHFEESIKYTPQGMEYENPKVGLKSLE